LERLDLDVDPYANDPGHWGASLINNAELLIGCLERAGAHSVIEVGAYAGDVTRFLVDWGAGSDRRLVAVDPFPQPSLQQLAQERDQLELIEQSSLDALKTVELADAVIIDGDHNYYTVSEELRILDERSEGSLPLLLFHDVCWPHARRDAYFTPEDIPPEYRQPMIEGAGLFPGVNGSRTGGLPYKWVAREEGGERNGVLTAIEDFAEHLPGYRLVVVPAFFGFGALWDRQAPYADALDELLDPWDGNPLLERLEANRVLHLASSHYHLTMWNQALERLARQEPVLQELLKSKSFGLAELISKLRQGGEPAISKDAVRRALEG
jgi:hypothetical protein